MPSALHPQAKFDPIPPDLDLHGLVDRTPNFDWVVRISTAQIRRLGSANFEKLVQLHVIEGGKPLVIEGWSKALTDNLFNTEWLEANYNKKQENIRDLGSHSDIPMTTGHYLRSMKQLTNQWSPTNFRDERRQRLYLKDIDCPPEWQDHLKKVIPPNLFYMNENISENIGVDFRDDDIFGAPEPTAAIAGDLMSSLPVEMRAQNLMCYIGHEGTYTPAHREMCASLGQNIMVDASGDQNGEKPGSSIWFMTETKDREVVKEYFLSMLGHDIEIEKHFAQINAWKKANFPVYVVEQKKGDFILVPPLAPHQVWNRGTRTIKVAWNRTTVETLDLALREALPKARLVCRDEQYKNKAIIYYTLNKYYKELQRVEENSEVSLLGLGRELTQNSPRLKQMASDFRRLFGLFTDILIDEMFAFKQAEVEFVPFDSNITCSYCRSNIFNRFLTCKCCVRKLLNGDEDTYDICMECYVMGRSCVCISGLQWCEQFRWADLVDKHEMWRSMIIKQDGFIDLEYSPQPLELARKKSGKKSVAQICQEQLRRRPWNDITKPPEPDAPESEEEVEVDDNGRVKKKKPKRKKKMGDTHRCHVCCHKDYKYKLNFCTTCTEAYCYGVLWRAFDTMPQAAMEKEHWQCPRCQGICNCGTCRRLGNTNPYIPKNTLLGHDTRKVADDRSVESIVDFRIHNLSWLKGAGEEIRSKDSRRMQKLKEKADSDKAKDPLANLDTSEDAPHEIDSGMQDSIMHDYADPSQNLGADGSEYNGESSTAQEENGTLEAGSRVEVANMSGTQNGEGDSVYPDPTDPAMRNRMMGMGFYDQDDSAEMDKILFDQFEIPSADTLNGDSEVSEFVKKALRLAKKKARLENEDDPDFRGPKSHKRKPRTGNIDQLMHLDPELIGALSSGSGNGNGTPTQGEAQPELSEQTAIASGQPPNAQSTQDQPRPKSTRPLPLPIDPLRPTLRHARPIRSYAEGEEPADDPDDLIPNHWFRTPNEATGEQDNVEKDSLDLALETIRQATDQSQSNPAVDTPKSTGKKRGRPPGRPSRSSLLAKEISASDSPSAPPARKRGRPRRSDMSHVELNKDLEMADEAGAQDNADTGDAPEAQLTAEPASQLEAEGDTDAKAPSSAPPTRAKRGRGRGRGRPPGRKSMPTTGTRAMPEPSDSESSDTPEPEQPPAFMSMAERMKARGGAFKWSGRGGPVSRGKIASRNGTRRDFTVRSPQDTYMADADQHPRHGRPELDESDFGEPRGDSSESASSVTPEVDPEPARPARKSGPTVVRIARSDDSSSASESGSEFDDDDDEDIPAKRRFVATRGRGRGRPRGRGGRRLV